MHLQSWRMHTAQACMALTMQPRDSPLSPAPRPKIRGTRKDECTAVDAISNARNVEHEKVLTRQSWCCTIGLVRSNVREERRLECRRGGDEMWQSRKEYTPGLLIKAAVGIRDDGMLNASVLLIYRSGTRLFGCSMIEQPSVRLCACIWINAESRDMSTYFSRCGACSAHVRTARACAVMSSARRTGL